MEGFTKEEAFLHSLGKESFLRFWSWPNLFRDQGDANKGGDGKEICDLTVIFGSNILLFSDKKIRFNTQLDISIGWNRWARKAIRDSVKQIKGAKRWLQDHPNRVYVDKQCTKELPIDIPKKSDSCFYNIVVCHGIEEQISGVNQEPSFNFDNTIIGESNWSAPDNPPFTLGIVSQPDFVHVFNEATIELVLKEFDTTKDFISYLQQREYLLTFHKPVKVKSESDIIQLYFENHNSGTNKYLISGAKELRDDDIVIDKGGISKLHFNPQIIGKKQADVVSYFWDDFIEAFSYHVLNESSEAKNWKYPNEIEPGLRVLAESNRFERRVLSDAFIAFYYKAQPDQRGTRIIRDRNNNSLGYVFLLLPFTPSVTPNLEVYREIHRALLYDYCTINKYLYPNLTTIIGLAAQTRETNKEIDDSFFNEGQDFVYCDFTDYSEAEYQKAKKLHDDFKENKLQGLQSITDRTLFDFPESINDPSKPPEHFQMSGNQRNKPCICGSGKKMKKCCGRN